MHQRVVTLPKEPAAVKRRDNRGVGNAGAAKWVHSAALFRRMNPEGEEESHKLPMNKYSTSCTTERSKDHSVCYLHLEESVQVFYWHQFPGLAWRNEWKRWQRVGQDSVGTHRSTVFCSSDLLMESFPYLLPMIQTAGPRRDRGTQPSTCRAGKSLAAPYFTIK